MVRLREAGVGFAVATAIWPGITSAIFVPRWAVIAVGLSICWKPGPRPLGWQLLLGLGLLASVISLLWTPDLFTGFYDLGLLGLLLLLAWQDWDFDSVMLGFAGGLGASSALLLLEAFSGLHLAEVATPAAGLFFNRDFLAEAAAIVFVWASLRRCWWSVGAAALPLLLCQSRVALLAVGGSLGWHWARGSLVRGGILLAAGLLASGWAFSGVGAAKLLSASARVIGWKVGVLLVSWQGLGIGWWHWEVPYGHLVHSELLQMADELGLGVLPFLALAGLLLVRGEWRDEKTIFLAVGVEALLSFPLHLPGTAFLAALVAGQLARRSFLVPLGQCLGREVDDRRSERGRFLESEGRGSEVSV